jgi:hypothetical protein
MSLKPVVGSAEKEDVAMSLTGKGVIIWKAQQCENGSPAAIARRAREAGLSHVVLKVADGVTLYNQSLAPAIVAALRVSGVEVWGWQYIYGDSPTQEAATAIRAVQQLGLDGFVVNAEREYESKFDAAAAYMDSLTAGLRQTPVAFSSFRLPDTHPSFPWAEFLSGSAYNMPQVFWVNDTDPAHQLDQSIEQFRHVYPVVPIIPTAAAYVDGAWRPSAGELNQIMLRVRECGLPGINFWNWDYAGNPRGSDLWNVIAGFAWPGAAQFHDPIDALFYAMNQGDVEAIVRLYEPDAVLVTPSRTLHGQNELRVYYSDLLSSVAPHGQFSIRSRVDEAAAGHVAWTVVSPKPSGPISGQDNIGLREGLIQYHSSIYHLP